MEEGILLTKNLPKCTKALISPPLEFELWVKKYLEKCGNINDINIHHNIILNAYDGDYQIDVYCELEILNISIKILIECKKHAHPIKREVVQLLDAKLKSTGCQKGIIFSTSDFQTGAQEYAEKHGIALIKVINGEVIYVRKSVNAPPLSSQEKLEVGIPNFAGEFLYDNLTLVSH